MIWTNIHRAGFLPDFLNENDTRTAVEQLHDNYAHGGGWNDFHGFALHNFVRDFIGKPLAELQYPGDPPMREVARTKLDDEWVILFECDWVAVIQDNGGFRVARLD